MLGWRACKRRSRFLFSLWKAFVKVPVGMWCTSFDSLACFSFPGNTSTLWNWWMWRGAPARGPSVGCNDWSHGWFWASIGHTRSRLFFHVTSMTLDGRKFYKMRIFNNFKEIKVFWFSWFLLICTVFFVDFPMLSTKPSSSPDRLCFARPAWPEKQVEEEDCLYLVMELVSAWIILDWWWIMGHLFGDEIWFSGRIYASCVHEDELQF